MRCGAEPDKNLARARAISFVTLPRMAPKSSVCRELFQSQYFCQTEDHANFALAEEIPGKSTSALGELARELKIVIVASLFEKRRAGVYHNTAAIIDADGKLLGKYRKMHIPDDPLYHEKFYFAPGDLGFQAWRTRARKNRRLRLLGPMVSGSGAANGIARRGNYFLSNGDRLASEREEGIREAAAFRLGNNSAQPRDRERLLRRRDKSRRSRSPGWRRRNRILGPKFYLRT